MCLVSSLKDPVIFQPFFHPEEALRELSLTFWRWLPHVHRLSKRQLTEQQQSYSGLRSPGRSTYFKMTPGFKTFLVLIIFVDMVIFTSFSYI